MPRCITEECLCLNPFPYTPDFNQHGGRGPLKNIVVKEEKCWLPAFSPFPTMFSKYVFFKTIIETIGSGEKKKMNLRYWPGHRSNKQPYILKSCTIVTELSPWPLNLYKYLYVISRTRLKTYISVCLII